MISRSNCLRISNDSIWFLFWETQIFHVYKTVYSPHESVFDWCQIETMNFYLVYLFYIKLLIQTITYSNIRFLHRLCINLSRDTSSYVFVTFRFNKVNILSLLMFHTMWVCFVKNFNVVLHVFFRRSLIYVFKSSLCVFVKLLIFLTLIDFNVLFNELNKAMSLYILRFVYLFLFDFFKKIVCASWKHYEW
jgi:hypothetical protein